MCMYDWCAYIIFDLFEDLYLTKAKKKELPSLMFTKFITVLTPCFWIDTFVRWTNMLSSSLTSALYLTVQNRQKPSLYLR